MLNYLVMIAFISATPDERLHKECIYPTLCVKNIREQTNGTAFITRSEKVGDKYHNVAITCNHVIKSSYLNNPLMILDLKYKNWSQIKNIQPSLSYAFSSSEEHDIAILLFETDQQLNCVNMKFNEKYYIGNPIFKIGCAFSDPMRYDEGKITAVPNFMDGRIRTSAFAAPGDSGGPLFHDYSVIGIVFAIKGESNGNISYCVPIDDLKKWNLSINNDISFVFDKKEKLPILPFMMKKLKNYKPEGD